MVNNKHLNNGVKMEENSITQGRVTLFMARGGLILALSLQKEQAVEG